MKELREKLKANAVSVLTRMTDEASTALGKIAAKGGVNRYELARLVVGGRVASVEKRIISRMVKNEANALLKQYMDQQELPLEEKPSRKK